MTLNAAYDAEADALFLRFADARITDTEEIHPGIMVDFDDEGRIVAIEVLDASIRLSDGNGLKRSSPPDRTQP